MRSFWLTLALAAAACAVLAPAAAADKPTREPVVNDDVVIRGVCGFPVLLEDVGNREKQLTFSDGRVLITGRLTVRITNLRSGAATVANASGPAHVSADGTRLTLLGRTLLFFAPGDRGPGMPGMVVLHSGRAVLDFTRTDPLVSMHGHTADLCRAVA